MNVVKLLGCVLGLTFYSIGSAVIIPDFQVNPQDTAFIAQYTTDIAFQPNGNFVVIWEDRGWDHDNRQVYFQRYDSLGNKLGPQVQVSDTITGYYNQECHIAADSEGNFAICYSSYSVVAFDIWVRLYNADGQTLTPSIKVDVDLPPHSEGMPHIAMHKSGKFVVVWQEQSAAYMGQRIYGQFFDSEGGRIGTNFRVDNPDSTEFPISPNYAFFPRVAITDNGYSLICWEGLPFGKIREYPLARLYSLDGISLRNVFTLLDLNDPQWIAGTKPDIDAAPANSFILSCNTNDSLYSYPNNAIIVTRFDTLGNPLNRPVVVNDTMDLGDNFRMPRVDAGEAGYVVVWSDQRTGDRNLMAQRFDYRDQAIGKNYRINGVYGSLTSPPDSSIGERQGNWFFYDLDINKRGRVGVSWSDYRNYVNFEADIFAKVLQFSEIGFYVPGDLNNDGVANLSDLIFLVNYIFKGGAQPLPLYPADVNGDCKVNLTDIIYLVKYLFKGGAPLKTGCA